MRILVPKNRHEFTFVNGKHQPNKIKRKMQDVQRKEQKERIAKGC